MVEMEKEIEKRFKERLIGTHTHTHKKPNQTKCRLRHLILFRAKQYYPGNKSWK